MPRDLPIGNGSLLITFDAQYCLRDLYFPNVGHENNTLGHPCRVGVWIDGSFRWLHDREGWERSLQYEPDTLVTDVTLEHREIGLALHFQDAVHPELLPADQVEVSNTMRAIEKRLLTAIGGVARYENDYHRHVSEDFHNVAGNPWFICTLWLAQWYVAIAKTPQDLARPREIVQWVAEHALPSGVLAEQLDPYSGTPCMVAPLTWSHATYVDVILKYQSKYHELFPEQEAPVGGDATPSPKTLRRMAVKRASREECPGLVRLGAL